MLSMLCIAACVALVCAVVLAESAGSPSRPSEDTRFSGDADPYGQLLDGLRDRLLAQSDVEALGGRDRTVYVPWIRDQVHVVKAMKYLAQDVSSLIEFYLENQTPEGLYYDYYCPIDSH